MANFNTHLSTALVFSTTASLIVYKAGVFSSMEFFCCAMAGTIGGLLPDIDLDFSIPARIGFNVVSMLVAFGAVIFWIGHLSVAELMLVWLFSYAIMRWGVFMLFDSLTVHRGIVHSIPYMLVLALGLVYASFYGLKNSAVFSWFLGAFLFFGSIVHLLLDEIYSVNIFGLTIKKSFGTAIKFFSLEQKNSYLALYFLIAVLLFFAPPFSIFWETVTNPLTVELLEKNLLPKFLIQK